MKYPTKYLEKKEEYSNYSCFFVEKCIEIFGKYETFDLFRELGIDLDEERPYLNLTKDKEMDIWPKFFELVYIRKGIQYLTILEPLGHMLALENGYPMPAIFDSALKKVEAETFRLTNENRCLKEEIRLLREIVAKNREKTMKCPITSLYNDRFFKKFLRKELDNKAINSLESNCVLMIISVDNLSKIRFTYGDNEADQLLKTVVSLIKENNEPEGTIFRLNGAFFACYFRNFGKEEAIRLAEKFRNVIAQSERFIEKITVSIGVTALEELNNNRQNERQLSEELFKETMLRVRAAKRKGMNRVSSHSKLSDSRDEEGKILVVDSDPINIKVLSQLLTKENYKVFIANDGEEAFNIAKKEKPSLIISEIMLPKMDGFLLKEQLNVNTLTKNIPFIIVSYLKDEGTVKRAADLHIEHNLKKPYLISELLGIIRNKVRRKDIYDSER